MLDNQTEMKTTTWIMRIDPSLKEEIEEAARSQGLTMTTFVTNAMRKAVTTATKKAAKAQSSRRRTVPVFGGVPTFFRAACAEAQSGGRAGYDEAAWHLANALGSRLQPDDVSVDEWESELETLRQRIDDRDDDAVWNWFGQHFPRCMELVPTRRRQHFVSGIRRALEEERF